MPYAEDARCQLIEQQRFRDLMSGVCAPVTVVTTSLDNVPHGATVSSFTSLSLDPPLVSVAFDRSSTVLRRIQQRGAFGVNLLGHTQDDLATTFARRGDRFGGASWYVDHGLPRLADAAGWVACDLQQVIEAGDHLLLFGLVEAASRTDLPPLIYANRTFGTHSHFLQRPRLPIRDSIAACAR